MPTEEPNEPSNLYDMKVSAEEEVKLVIPVIEEKVKVGKTVVESGRVRIIKTVDEHEELVTLPLTEEEVVVVRKPVDKYIETPPSIRHEGETTIYPVIKEVLVVEKKLLLIEEIHVTKNHRTTIASETINLRTESISVEREKTEEGRPG